MSSNELKYKTAWDNKLQKYVTPYELQDDCIGEPIRFFSEKFDAYETKGDILRLVRSSTALKNGKQIEIQKHFVKVCDNTRENRENIQEKIELQDELIREALEDIATNNKLIYIKLPTYKISLFTTQVELVQEQIVKVQNIEILEVDNMSGNLQIMLKAFIFGIEQNIFIELKYYKKDYNQTKLMHSYYNHNSLIADISSIKTKLNITKQQIEKTIIASIENQLQWASCKLEEVLIKKAMREKVVEISANTATLHRSNIYTEEVCRARDLDYYKYRYYTFKDEITQQFELEDTHPCFSNTDTDNAINIGDCLNCNRCITLENYTSQNIDDTKVYCNKHEDVNRASLLILLNELINRAKEIIKNEETDNDY